jgi:hypothetical protein
MAKKKRPFGRTKSYYPPEKPVRPKGSPVESTSITIGSEVMFRLSDVELKGRIIDMDPQGRATIELLPAVIVRVQASDIVTAEPTKRSKSRKSRSPYRGQ